MAISYSFTDNVSYGTEDINAIARDLTGAGISPFPTQDTYSTADLNMLTEGLVSSGVSLNGCLCSKKNNMVSVSQGTVFFENGVRLCVNADGYKFAVPSATPGYVYAYFNASLQCGGIEFSEALPENDLYVLLAEISSGGVLKDARMFARSKIATFGTNVIMEKDFTMLETPIPVSENTLITRRLEGVDLSKFNYAILSFWSNRGIFDLKTGKFVVSYIIDEEHDDVADNAKCGGNIFHWVTGSGVMFEIEKDGNTLIAKQTSIYEADAYGENRAMTAKLI